MARFHFARSASLLTSLLGALINLAFFLQLLSAWRSLRWEPESEWEGGSDSETIWRGDGLKLVWALLSAYFAFAAGVCGLGFIGIVKGIPSLLRFYRDYSIADFVFTSLSTLFLTYLSFTTTYLRQFVCEALSRQPDLMRDLAEAGLSAENCEMWFERAVLAGAMGMLVLMVVRIHFLIALSNYYTYVSRHGGSTTLPMYTPSHSHSHSHSRSHSQQIYLLPSSSKPTEPIIYTPIPLSTLPSEIRSRAIEAWVSPSPSTSRHRRSGSLTNGRISLPVRPGEGLLPYSSASESESEGERDRERKH